MKDTKVIKLSSILKSVTAMVVVLSLSGCISEFLKPQASESINKTPEMVFDAPRDTSQFYYAADKGETVELAKNNALAQIASRISVLVKAEIDNETKVRTEGGETDIEDTTISKVNARAKAIEFTGVNIEQTDTVSGLKHVIVSVDRNILFQSYVRKFEAIDAKIKKEIAIFNKSPVFSQLKLSYDINTLISNAKAEIKILKAMRPSYDDKVIIDRYSAYEDKVRSVKQKAVFSITADKNSQSLATLIKNYLSEESIKMAKNGANVRLHISTTATDKKFKTSNSKLANTKIVNRVSSLKVKDRKGVVISNNVVKTKGSSSASREDAIQQTRQYERLIEKDGILSFISGNK